MRYPNIARAVTSAPWAILPEQGAALLEVLELRLAGQYVSDDRIRAVAEAAAARRAATPTGGGAIAVVPVYGVIAQRMNVMMEMCGGASTEQIGAAFDAAMANPQVSAVVLDIDSPGGSVSGVPELAAKIRAARGTKPIIAVANSLAASAAYWIASAADEIVASPSADVGSIGVYQAHLDASEALAEEGLRYTLISAGKYKVEGNPYEPLSEEARAAMQGQVDEWYSAFVGAVARNRGVSAATVRDGYGEGRVLTAKQALAAGMVDRIASLDDVLAEFTGGRGARTTRRSAAAETPAVFAATPNELTSDDSTSVPADEAADAATSLPLDPAPQAEEHTVSHQNTAAPNGAVTEAPAREAQLRQLARLAGKDLDWLDAKIAAGTTLEDAQAEVFAERRQGAQPAASAAPRISGMVDRAADRAFGSFGEQLHAIVQAGKPGGRRDPRLARISAAASGMNESVGSEGGFFIEPQLLPGVMDPVYADDPILSRVTRVPIGAGKNAVKYNVVDETSRATGSRWGGIQMYWAAEADTATASKPKLRQMQLELKKLIGIAYLTEELTEDAPAAESLLTRAFQAEARFMLANGIFRGTGAGQMLGFLNSGAVVSQAIESAQTIANTAASISTNVTKMLARIPASLWGSVIWLYQQELLPYLVNATNGSSGAVPLFMAAGGLADRPSDTILGRPAFASELCEAVGTAGDLIALVPSEYHMSDKGGPEQATSVHVRFLYDEMTLKITMRADGAPVWRSSVTPFKGANARSPFVTLAARA